MFFGNSKQNFIGKGSILLSLLIFTACGKKNNNTLEAQQLNNKDILNPNKLSLTWQLPELTDEEKENLLKSVQIIFNDFYVNRLQKISDYKYDAIKEANKLNINMTSENLLKSTMAIFTNIRDLHTGFIYPMPARCVIGGFPLTVNLAYDPNGRNEKLIISSKLTENPNFILQEDNENFNAIQPKDEIISITHLGLEGVTNSELSSKAAIIELGKISRGANEDAFKTRAAQNFFSRNGSYMKTPEGRFSIKIKKASDGKIVSYSFPWLTYKSTASMCNGNSFTTLANTNSPDNTSQKTNNAISINNNSFAIKYNKTNMEELFKDLYSSSTKKLSTNIQPTIIEKGDKKFAIVRINSFMPSGNYDIYKYLEARKKIDEEVNSLRKFIFDNKDSIDGVIFDVRGNGGGYGSFPQLIANMFTNKFVKNMNVSPLVSQINRDTFYNLEMSRYYSRKGTVDELKYPILNTVFEMDKLINGKFSKLNVSKRELLLEPEDRYDGDENDALPSSYNKEDTEILKPIFTEKPVAVLTNSNCFSACDMFTSLFKDYKIARIFGETRHTGGGGANVIEWKDFLTPVVIDDKGTKSSIIPNGKELPKGSEIRFAWNKIKRENTSKYEQYIEGIGVIADYIYKPTSDDIVNNDKIIFDKIMEDMSDFRNPKGFYLNR
jgi:C-terminal processing protease CtpA/Prc